MVLQRSPSEILISLSSALPAETFVQLLRKHLYPALDYLPDAEKFNISSIFEPIEHANLELANRIASIDYDGIDAKLSDKVTALCKRVKRQRRGDYDIQYEMMAEIAEVISHWLPILWIVGVEDGLEIPLVHKCLKLCHRTIIRVYDCESCADFSDIIMRMDSAVKIADKSGKIIYSARGGCYQAISWLWRDLLISSLEATSDDVQANAIIDDISEINFTNDVADQLRSGSGQLSLWT
ncbi:hypothetical protein BU17DRAFT_50724 [Hysterangium stoloniferum]|nr:hypothetical protein BU17DRAFT_50724 [Hysterangium stoloniferum]